MPEWIQIESGILAVVTLLVAIGVWLGRITANQNYFKDFMKEIKGDLHVTQSDLRETQKDLHETQSVMREIQSVMREIQSNLREINSKAIRYII